MPLAILELDGNDYKKFVTVQEDAKIELNEETQTYGTMEDTKVRLELGLKITEYKLIMI